MTTHSHHPRNDLALAEAALFLAPQPLTRRGLAKILGGVAQAYVDQLLEDLKERYEDPSRGIELHVEEGRAQLRVKPAYVNEVAHLAPQHDIPRQELRTLAVIAYNHPMTQANLIKIRGNKGYQHVQQLIDRNLITSEPHGRTCLLRVTRDFLRHFGLNSVDEFRIQFPTAADENAEALARETPGEDKHSEQSGELGEMQEMASEQASTDTHSAHDDSAVAGNRDASNPEHAESRAKQESDRQSDTPSGFASPEESTADARITENHAIDKSEPKASEEENHG